MKLLVLDPLTLLGREFVGCSDRLARGLPELDFLHTNVDEEHQIAELEGGPALVPPLTDAGELGGCDVVVVASDVQSSRHDHLLDFLDREPGAAVLDLSRLELLYDLTTPVTGRTPFESRRLRVAHPALVAASRIVDTLAGVGRLSGCVAIVDPVSASGRDAIDLLVQQSIQRLRGEQVSELIYDHIRAFNVVAVDPFDLQEEAAQVLPEVPLAVTHSLSGSFHGHLAHLALRCDRPVTPDAVRDALDAAEDLEAAAYPSNLDAVPDTDRITVAPPAVSADGHQIALTIMVDGLRVGGALTAVAILDDLI